MTGNDSIFKLMEYTRGLPASHINYRPCHIILRQLSNIQNYSIHTLADLCCVSPATLSRLSRELGYKSFQDFKISLITSFRYIVEGEDLDRHFESPRIDAAIPEESRTLNYLDYSEIGLKQVRDFVMSGDALKHINLIRRCNMIAFFISADLDIIPFARKVIAYGKQLTVFSKDISNILKPDEFGLSNNISDVCYILALHTNSDLEFFAPQISYIRAAGGSVIVVCPDYLALDKSLPDQYFVFSSRNTIGDDITFQSYMNVITVMF